MGRTLDRLRRRAKSVQEWAYRRTRRRAFEREVLRELPPGLRPAATFVFHGRCTSEEAAIASRIEGYRAETRRMQGEIESFSSPRSGSFSKDAAGRAVPGPRSMATVEAHAWTGMERAGGILLRRLTEGLPARRVLELGTNTGISGCYFLSAPVLESLVTIEGSAGLCRIADENLRRMSARYEVRNALFDTAIADLASEGARFDLVFIDGQHERQATWHYVQQLLPVLAPTGAFLFDDIYWSDDMNVFWREVCASEDFGVTVDFQRRGLAMPRVPHAPKAHYDMCKYVGRPSIYLQQW